MVLRKNVFRLGGGGRGVHCHEIRLSNPKVDGDAVVGLQLIMQLFHDIKKTGRRILDPMTVEYCTSFP